MTLESFCKFENLSEISTDFASLREEWLNENHEVPPEEDLVIQSIDNLLEEIKSIKTKKDYTLRKELKIVALLTWVSRVLESMHEEEEGDEDFSFMFDDEDDEGEYELDEVEEFEVTPATSKGNKKEKAAPKPAAKNTKKKK